MKKIIIEGIEYYYMAFKDGWGSTDFYVKENYINKKFLIFGKDVIRTRFVKKFGIKYNIESPYNSKEVINFAINRELAILKRKEEIERGEII